MPWVYIVRCADDTLYTGFAVDLDRRLAAHNAGTGARYTSGRRPVRLVYAEARRTRGAALRREHGIKQLSREAKEALIAATPAAQACDGGETQGPRRPGGHEKHRRARTRRTRTGAS